MHPRSAGVLATLRALFRRERKIVTAVEGVSFEIGSGERVGFLGPNGAGKTTTLKMLAGLLHPTSGEVRVDGHVPKERETAFLDKISLVMGQKGQLLWDLPPLDTFEMNRAVYAVPRPLFEARVRELGALLEVGDVVRKPSRELSLGERMRCELIAALIHGPKLLFLDEPTIGLDVTMQAVIRSFLRRYGEEHGATLILTSHDLDDVAALCPRVLVIDQGALSYDGSLGELSARMRPDKRVSVRFSRPVARADVEALGTLVTASDEHAVVDVPRAELGARLASMLATLPVLDLEVTSAPLEEVVTELFTRTRARKAHGEPPGASGGS